MARHGWERIQSSSAVINTFVCTSCYDRGEEFFVWGEWWRLEEKALAAIKKKE
jgi:hypothetical protein